MVSIIIRLVNTQVISIMDLILSFKCLFLTFLTLDEYMMRLIYSINYTKVTYIY